MMKSMPTGTVTFLFTDIEGSTKAWEQYPAKMQGALSLHDETLSTVFSEYGGVVVKHRGEGDSFFVVFPVPSNAIQAAVHVQEKLAGTDWPTPEPLQVRMALHTGEAEFRDGDYFGPAVNRCARLRSAAHGGQVIISATAAQLVEGLLPPHIALLDLGSHRLKDLNTQEQVFQLVYPGLPDKFPPLRSLQIRLNNLPLQATPFIGRESELKELHARLLQTRLLSLLGSGGAGKTRLSLQLAAESAEQFPDGVWLVELAPLQDQGLLIQTVASIFSIKEQSHISMQEALSNHIQSKRLLLVLDNCEHLIETSAMLAAHVIQKCPGVKMIATSREPLNITGESIWRVPSLSLPLPDAHGSSEQLLKYAAVQLFVDRVLSVKPDFTVTAHNAMAIADICRCLDGIPLALELAAARVKSLTVEQIALRLGESFRLLSGGDRTRLPRQQTLRALVDWSYDLLNKLERIMLRRLSVFAGSFRLEAAEEICCGEGVDEFEVIDLLGQLVDKSLVIAEEREGDIRYHLLMTIRQYGEERLIEAGERDPVLEKHCDYYLSFIEKSIATLHSPHHNQGLVIKEWAREMDNLRAAIDWSLQTAASSLSISEKAGRLISASAEVWSSFGQAREGYGRLMKWLELPNSTAFLDLRANVLLKAALLTIDRDLQQAFLFIEESLETARKAGVSITLSRGLYFMAYAFSLSGQNQKAIELYDEAYESLKQLNSVWDITRVLRFKAVTMMVSSDFNGAKSILEQCLQMCGELEYSHEEAAVFRVLGSMALLEKQIPDAKQYYRNSLAITSDFGDKECTLDGLLGVFLTADAVGNKELAAWIGGAYEALSLSTWSNRIDFYYPNSKQVNTSLKAGYPEIWSSGNEASYDEAVAKAKSFVE